MDRKADARWEGDLRSGKGSIRLGSGAFEGPYSFGTRFEGAQGTNPEELLGAAHAGCFSMAMSLLLSQQGFTATRIDTTAVVHLQKGDAGFSITGADLVTRAEIPGISREQFQAVAEDAKANCIISRALAFPITLQATLVGG
jgi:osmotically inducible protein OsmC